MFYLLTSIPFSTVACETSNPCTFKCVSYVSVSNTNDMEFRLFIALGNKSKQQLFHAEKACL